MRRHLLTLSLAGLFGAFMLASDASACCHKKKAACAAPAPAVCEAPAPAPVAECPKPAKKCCFKLPKLKLGHGGLCHKKKAEPCPAPATCEAPVYTAPAPVYAAPVMPSGQYATGQS